MFVSNNNNMNYGTQKFMENMRELTPEEKAKQDLAIEAIKEQARYERKQRNELASKVKEAGAMLYKFITIVLLALILAFAVGCTKEETCEVFDLGKVGEQYIPIETDGLNSVIYVEGDRVKQEVCWMN